MSVFSDIYALVGDYELWKHYEPVVNDVEAALMKHGIDVASMMLSGPKTNPSVAHIQQKLNQIIATNPTLRIVEPLAVDGIVGPETIVALQTVLKILSP